jgi:hypothetical protein
MTWRPGFKSVTEHEPRTKGSAPGRNHRPHSVGSGALNALIWLPSMSSGVRGDEPEGEFAEVVGVYPVARPVQGGDARFTYGLALDVAEVLARHGYPPIRDAVDLVRVQGCLFELIYGVVG